ncbi:CAP domain-containing protein [Streptomyces sp. MPA0124]|uniref:CAP domain-containing protein n=1 Tax=unclassified Streptomyces TaxID=2593676 RepID=UPI0022F0CE4D|nr:CAP domain-containing protein [Streptomyces sp. MS2A]
MGSRRAARPSRSHARPRGGLRARGTALALGAVTLTAGVGITLAVTDGEDGGASDRVTANAAGQEPNAEDAAGGAAPLAPTSASPSATASGSPSESAEPERKPEKTASPTTSAAKAPAPASKAPVKVTTKSAGDGSGGNGASGGGSGSGAGGGSGSGSGSGSGATGGAEAQVLALVNEERAAAGCSPVTANDRLTRAADDYSDVMASSGVMSHTGPDGSTMASRVEAAGYRWSTLGENIARGQADAASVMDSWMNSPGHRANILNCSFKELGVGVHFGDGGPWWTQDFGTGR